MGESLTKRRRVCEEGLRVVKHFEQGRRDRCEQWRNLTVPAEPATANLVPAAAVRREWQALFGFTGRKGGLGGQISSL